MPLDPQTGIEVPDEQIEAQTQVPADPQVLDVQDPSKAPEMINIIKTISDDDLLTIGKELADSFEQDWNSASEYRDRSKDYLKFYANTKEEKSYPWPKASNVKLPMLSNAVTQFQARAYEEIVTGRGIVNIADPLMDDKERAKRVERHFNHQILIKDDDFEEDYEAGLVQLGLNGDLHRKIFFDQIKNQPVTKYITVEDFVIDYNTRQLEDSRRYTHKMRLSRHDLNLGVKKDVYRKEDIDKINDQETDLLEGPVVQQSKDIDGIHKTPDSTNQTLKNLRDILEIHTWWDLNDDGIEEPYVFTIDRTSQRIIRVTSRSFKNAFDEDEVLEYFVHYRFLPNPEGYYGLGLGHKLMGLQNAENSVVNQLIDAGTLSNLSGGFVNQKSGIKRGHLSFRPGEFKVINSPVDDISRHIFQMRHNPPDQTLFALLGFIDQMGQKESNVSSLLSGISPGANTPATTTIALLEQGLKVFGSIQKRIRRALTRELKSLYRLNSIFLKQAVFERGFISRGDYRPDSEIIPTADPNISSKAQKLIIATEKYNIGLANPLISNNAQALWKLTKEVYEAMSESRFEELLPEPPKQPEGPPDIDPVTEDSLIIQGQLPQALQPQNHELHIQQHRDFAESPLFANFADSKARSSMEAHLRQHAGMLHIQQVQIQQAMEQQIAQQQAAEAEQLTAAIGGGQPAMGI